MRTSIQGPLRYIQEAGILRQAGPLIAQVGGRALVLLTKGSMARVGATLEQTMVQAGCACLFEPFSGDVTYPEIDRVAAAAREKECDLLVGIGGGRVLDTARVAADQLGRRLVIIPTTASSDAPCSAVAVIHDENGRAVEIRGVRRNPDLVLVDTEIVANAPAHYLTAGIGDALATYFEARAYARKEQAASGTSSTRTAVAMSRLCYELIVQHGPEAMEAVRAHRVTDALELTVHAAIYLSGYGFENGNVAAAHAVNEGFSVIPRCSKILHGILVGFGVLVQMELEQAPEEERRQLRQFMRSVGLPVTLRELGLDDLTEEELRAISEAACSVPPMRNMPMAVTADMVYQAIRRADSF